MAKAQALMKEGLSTLKAAKSGVVAVDIGSGSAPSHQCNQGEVGVGYRFSVKKCSPNKAEKVNTKQDVGRDFN
jgi:hypothetical protein